MLAHWQTDGRCGGIYSLSGAYKYFTEHNTNLSLTLTAAPSVRKFGPHAILELYFFELIRLDYPSFLAPETVRWASFRISLDQHAEHAQ